MKKILFILYMTIFLFGSYFLKTKYDYGCISGNCSNGDGTYYFVNGDTYTGLWKHNLFNGEGTFFWLNKEDKYTGYWKNGKRHGKGVFYYKSGLKLDGKWVEDEYVFFE